MKTKSIVLSLFALTILNSCSEPAKEESTTSAVIEQQKEEQTEPHSKEIAVLSLNKGEKWVANKETHDGMSIIKTILEKNQPATVEEFQEIGNEFSLQTKFIISNCSMKGESHDQLHLVLLPVLDNIKALKTSTTIEAGKTALTELDKNILDYFTFFKAAE
jgi:hypothetical protein